MTRTLATILPFPAAIECVQEIDRARGREVAAALVDFMLFCDVQSCDLLPEGESLRTGSRRKKPAGSAGSGGAPQGVVDTYRQGRLM